MAAAAIADPAWMAERLGRPVASVRVEDMSAAGGWSGDMQRVHVEFADGGSPKAYVLKQTKTTSVDQAKSLGLAREGLFYQELAPALGSTLDLPPVVFASADFEAGTRAVLMEDLSSGVQSGYFFGPGSPHNWSKDLAALTRGWSLDAAAVTAMSFAAAARLHGRFWMQEDLKGKEWLRGTGWLDGADREGWERYQSRAGEYWAAARSKGREEAAAGVPAEDRVQFSPELADVIDASFAKVDWDVFQSDLKKRPWTLVHGDFHPANMIVRPGPGGNAEGAFIAIFDYEQVGLGSGPQDLGQYVISHTDPADRVKHEVGAVREYYRLLCLANPAVEATLDWDTCWAEYKHGGVARWAWLLAYIAHACPAKATQFFHDQILAFIQTHGITPENVQMPRV